MELTDSKLGKEYVKAAYCHPANLTYNRVHHEKCRAAKTEAGIKIAERNINNLRYAGDITLMAESEEELKSYMKVKVKEESEKAGSKLNVQKAKTLESGPITSRQIGGETMETVTDFIFLGSQITADGDCSHEIKRYLLLGEKSYDKNRQHIKKQRHYFSTKVCIVKAIPIVMYGCESWAKKKAEHQRIDVFELWCWKRLLGVPWTARRPNQSILKEISPEYSLEGRMLKLKLKLPYLTT